MRVVIDTNIVVSALITAYGPSARIIDLIILGQITPVFDDRIIAEYREVLARPKFNFHERDINALMDLLDAEGESIVAAPLIGVALPDSDDLQFLEVATMAPCPLITGNKKHYPESALRGISAESPILVMSPAEFLEQEAAGGDES